MAGLSEGEWKIMKVLWKHTPCTANQLTHLLKDHADWSSNTVRTMLNRLVKKEVISYHHNKNVYVYYPLKNKDECLKEETKSFFKRIYQEPLKAILVNFIQEEKLSQEDIEEIKEALAKKEIGS